MLCERRFSTEKGEGSGASGSNATDDPCQLANHHLTDEEEPCTGLRQRAPKYSGDFRLNNPREVFSDYFIPLQ